MVFSVNIVILYECSLSFLLNAPGKITEFVEGMDIGVISTVAQAMGFVQLAA